MHREAVISSDGLYRYALLRVWDNRKPRMTFIGLNPSIADDEIDTPTIKRCIMFAKRENMGGIHVVNLFAYRSPTPSVLKEVEDPIGPNNRFWLHAAFQHNNSGYIVGIWGTKADKEQINFIRKLAKQYGTPIYSLGHTKSGAPKHPLYTSIDQKLEIWY